MRWVEALKIWNGKRGGMWCVPRKGTEDHAEVKAIMAASKGEAASLPHKEEPAAPKKTIRELRAEKAAEKAKDEAPVHHEKKHDLRHALLAAFEERKAAKAATHRVYDWEEEYKHMTADELKRYSQRLHHVRGRMNDARGKKRLSPTELTESKDLKAHHAAVDRHFGKHHLGK